MTARGQTMSRVALVGRRAPAPRMWRARSCVAAPADVTTGIGRMRACTVPPEADGGSREFRRLLERELIAFLKA